MFEEIEKRIAARVSARIEKVILQRMAEIDATSKRSTDIYLSMYETFRVIMERVPDLNEAVESYCTASDEATEQLGRLLDEGKRIEQLQNEVAKLTKIVQQKEKQLRMMGRGE